MLFHRKMLLLGVVFVVGGSLVFTSAYGLRIRSESYRRDAQVGLSEFFDLPCTIGRIRGRTFSSRSFEEVTVFLPDRRDRVFTCSQAVWHEERGNGREAHRLELVSGALALGSDRWVGEDYRQVLRSGLEHDFEDLNLREVTLSDFAVLFQRGSLSIDCRGVEGDIDMSRPGRGVARLDAYEFNGYRVSEGVGIRAIFSPRNGVEVSELILSLPEVPLASIGLNEAIGTTVTRGRFAGRVRYYDHGVGRRLAAKSPGNSGGDSAQAGGRGGNDDGAADGQEILLDGQLHDAELAELTARLPIPPMRGRISVQVQRARISDALVTHFVGRGRLDDVSLAPLGPLLGLGTLGGTASFNFDDIDLALSHVNRLRFQGQIDDVALEQVLKAMGRGSATGRLSVRISNVEVVKDVIRSADIEIRAIPPAGGPGTIDRSLLLSAARQVFDFELPPFVENRLPDHVEYAEFGLRLLVKDNRMRILGTHGEDGETILTIVLFGAPVGVINERPGTIDLGPYLRNLLERVRSYDPSAVRDWWDEQRKNSAAP